MTTSFATSPDGLKLAYDRIGTGPALVLLHGGGAKRWMWHEAGYVKRLQDAFTVIPIDLRGHGESDSRTDPADYTIDKMMQDVLSVADACGVERFTLWGFSFGGRVGRHIAAHSGRVAKAILMGTSLGKRFSPQFRKEIKTFPAHWLPIIQAHRDGTLDLDSLSRDDRELWEDTNVPAMLGWGPAMLNWPSVEPSDFHCPVLWLVGSEDSGAMTSVMQYKSSLKDTSVQLHIMDGLNHFQVFEDIDKVFAPMLAFTQS